MGFDLNKYENIDWDDDEDPVGNTAHCLRHDVTETVVYEVLSTNPVVTTTVALDVADFAIVGPDRAGSYLWTILMDESGRGGYWLRPITGWKSKRAEIEDWKRKTGLNWRGRND